MPRSSKELVENKLKNPVYCRTLYAINKQKVSLTYLAKELGKTRTAIHYQVQELIKEGLLIKHAEKKEKLYSVNWGTLIQRFIEYAAKEESKYHKRIKAEFKDHMTYIKKMYPLGALDYVALLDKKQSKDQDFSERLKKNRILIGFMKDMLVQGDYFSVELFTLDDFFQSILTDPFVLDFTFSGISELLGGDKDQEKFYQEIRKINEVKDIVKLRNFIKYFSAWGLLNLSFKYPREEMEIALLSQCKKELKLKLLKEITKGIKTKRREVYKMRLKLSDMNYLIDVIK